MVDLIVKIGVWTVGNVTYGMDCRLEEYPTISYPRVEVVKEEIPERYIPSYRISKTAINAGDMTLIINTLPTKTANPELFREKVIEPLTHRGTVEIEFMEEGGILYTCEIGGIKIENLGEKSGAYRYTLTLSIEKIRTREV